MALEKELTRDGATLASAELAASAAAGLAPQDPVLASVLASNAKLAAPEPKLMVDDEGRPVQPVQGLDGKAVPASEVGVDPLDVRSAKDLFAQEQGGTTKEDLAARTVATNSEALKEAVVEEGGPGPKAVAGDKALGPDGKAALDAAALTAAGEGAAAKGVVDTDRRVSEVDDMDAAAKKELLQVNAVVQNKITPDQVANNLATQIAHDKTVEREAAPQHEAVTSHDDAAASRAAEAHRHEAAQQEAQHRARDAEDARAQAQRDRDAAEAQRVAAVPPPPPTREHHAAPAEPPRDGGLALPGRGDSQAQPAQVELPVIHVEAAQVVRPAPIDFPGDSVSASLRAAPDPVAAVQVAAAAPQSVRSPAELTAEVQARAAESARAPDAGARAQGAAARGAEASARPSASPPVGDVRPAPLPNVDRPVSPVGRGGGGRGGGNM